jgi:hypothetical protein
MLSVIDLVEAGTLSVRWCAFLLRCIERGASWLVGARPGGAGKTTVMSALLAMLPQGTGITLTNAGTGWERSGPGDCVVCYEISAGSYDAYLWGSGVRVLTELGRSGCRIVSNLHADTLEEAREQIVDDCGAFEEGFGAFDLFIPLTLKKAASMPGVSSGTDVFGRRAGRIPVIERVHMFREETWCEIDEPEVVQDDGIESFLRSCLHERLRTVEQVRGAWLRAR